MRGGPRGGHSLPLTPPPSILCSPPHADPRDAVGAGMERSLSSPGTPRVGGPHFWVAPHHHPTPGTPFHLPLPPSVELAEVFHVDGGTAPVRRLLPAQGLVGARTRRRHRVPIPLPGVRHPPHPTPPVLLTLIQGWTRHSVAVMRCLQHRGMRWLRGTVGVLVPHIHHGDGDNGDRDGDGDEDDGDGGGGGNGDDRDEDEDEDD